VGIYPEPRFLPCGDLALSVELGDDINRTVNARVLARPGTGKSAQRT